MEIKDIFTIALTSISTGILGYTLAIVSKNRQLAYENIQLRHKIKVMEMKFNPTEDDKVDMVDIYRMQYKIDEYIDYFYYQEYCMANNIIPDKESRAFTVIKNTLMDDPELQSKYPEYWQRIK